jgi:DNA repair exonuclease SbcCD ATPase subunit
VECNFDEQRERLDEAQQALPDSLKREEKFKQEIEKWKKKVAELEKAGRGKKRELKEVKEELRAAESRRWMDQIIFSREDMITELSEAEVEYKKAAKAYGKELLEDEGA